MTLLSGHLKVTGLEPSIPFASAVLPFPPPALALTRNDSPRTAMLPEEAELMLSLRIFLLLRLLLNCIRIEDCVFGNVPEIAINPCFSINHAILQSNECSKIAYEC